MYKKHVAKRVVLGLLVTVLLATTACSSGEKAATESTSNEQTTQSTGAEAPKAVEMPKKLRIFSPLSELLSKTGRSNNDNLSYQLLQEKTGTEIEWIHPSAGADYREKFNLLIASKDLPDIVWHSDWKSVPGGLEKYVEDGIVIKLNEIVEEQMPNYNKLLNELPNARKNIAMDNGDIITVTAFRKDPELMVFRGPVIRQDWLDKLNLKVPETTDDLYSVLKAIKTESFSGKGTGDVWPLSGLSFTHANFGIGHLLWPFGINYSLYQVDGKVKFGPMEPEFTEGMSYINKLYAEGLLDPDYVVQDRNKLDGKYMNNQVGFEYGMQPTKMGSAMEVKDPEFKALGTPHLKGKEGKAFVFDVEYTNYVIGFNSAAITTACKDPNGAAKWMDFLFSDEGYMITNFGKLDDTYTMVDGKPKYTDKILKNPEGLDYTTALNKYTFGNMASFPYASSWDSYSQSLHKNGAASISTWAKSADTSRVLPQVTLTQEEQNKINDKLNDINTYIEEQFNKLVTGQTPISEIPKIQEKLKSMGIDEVISVYNAALDRYNAKK